MGGRRKGAKSYTRGDAATPTAIATCSATPTAIATCSMSTVLTQHIHPLLLTLEDEEDARVAQEAIEGVRAARAEAHSTEDLRGSGRQSGRVKNSVGRGIKGVPRRERRPRRCQRFKHRQLALPIRAATAHTASARTWMQSLMAVNMASLPRTFAAAASSATSGATTPASISAVVAYAMLSIWSAGAGMEWSGATHRRLACGSRGLLLLQYTPLADPLLPTWPRQLSRSHTCVRISHPLATHTRPRPCAQTLPG